MVFIMHLLKLVRIHYAVCVNLSMITDVRNKNDIELFKIFFNALSPDGTHMYYFENFLILKFLKILEKYFQ